MPRRGRLWVSRSLPLGLFALGYAIVADLDPEGRTTRSCTSPGISEAQELFGGIPQEGDRLGSSDAPVTIQLFNDLQCSNCSEDFLGTIPDAGRKLRPAGRREAALPPLLEQRKPVEEIGFYGAEAAAEQGYGWQYIYLFFRNQDEAERLGGRPGLPRLDRRRGRGTERARMGSRPGRKRRPRRRDLRAAGRLRGTRARPRASGPGRRRSSPARTAPGRSRTAPKLGQIERAIAEVQ